VTGFDDGKASRFPVAACGEIRLRAVRFWLLGLSANE